MMSGELCKLYSDCSGPTFWGTFYITTLTLSIKVQKRNGIARQKWTKNKCPFFKRAVGLCEMGSMKNTLLA